LGGIVWGDSREYSFAEFQEFMAARRRKKYKKDIILDTEFY